MSLIDQFKKSEVWQSTESRSAIFVTGILTIIAAFLVYNYYQKTDEINTSTNDTTTIGETITENDNDSTGETLGTQDETNAYVVEASDTLWSIAEKQLGDPYRWTELKELNKLESSELEAGQVLMLPEDTTTEIAEVVETEEEPKAMNDDATATNEEEVIEEEPQEDTTETIIEDDTPELEETETIEEEETNGEVLAETMTDTTPETYTVERGDTLWSIAQKIYGDPYKYVEILKANSQLGRLPNGNVLIHSGNVLVIPNL